MSEPKTFLFQVCLFSFFNGYALLIGPHLVVVVVLLLHTCPARLVCRDIGGSDPERMAAPRVAEYVQELFTDSPVQVGD